MSALDWFVGELSSNRRLVATLLDVLLQSGDAAAHARVVRRLEIGQDGLSRAGGWLPEETVLQAFEAGGATPGLARRVGQSLVSTDAIGAFLCHSGVATVEKAYRRAHHLLPREAEGARWREPDIEEGRATIRFKPIERVRRSRARADEMARLLCEARRGMLEAVPLVFGLLPAQVREVECAHRGQRTCTYELKWGRTTRRGMIIGAGVSLALAISASLGLASLGTPIWLGFLLGLPLIALGALAGRSFDLSRQLEAVAGARRGHLALLDQVDQSLAEKLDELAKLSAPAAMAGTPLPLMHPNEEGLVPVSRDVRPEPQAEARRERIDLRAVVERATQSVIRNRPMAEAVPIDLDSDTPKVLGDSFQLEFMIEQLFENALDASDGIDGVRLSLAPTSSGAELVVTDEGQGIDPETLDRLFDPFFDVTTAGADGAFSLPVCYRIVAEHGGVLRVESRPEEGTRVFVSLPSAD